MSPSRVKTLLHRGSVKDIYTLVPAPNAQAGSDDKQLLFKFSNRYSIFDWGEMPDEIPGKGAALALMGRKLLAHLNERGFPTHYIGEGSMPEDMIVKSVEVPRGNPEAYHEKLVNTLVPLEVIYRFGAPKGSSLFRRFKNEAGWKAAGYDRAYYEGEDFSHVKLDFTTKLERMDRELSITEAQKIAGITDIEWDSLTRLTQSIANEVKKVFAEVGLKLWDGKFEFAFIPGHGDHAQTGSRDFMLVDTIGLDEIRLTFDGFPLSKELLRQFYLNTKWYDSLVIAKKEVPDRFREYCEKDLGQSPESLPPAIVNSIGRIYTLAAEMILNSNAHDIKAFQTELRAKLDSLAGGLA